jgi:hypothetical protein
MRIPWKVVGLAGVAGVAAGGAVVVRRRRTHREYDPDELRARLHDRLRQAGGEGDAPPSPPDPRAP